MDRAAVGASPRLAPRMRRTRFVCVSDTHNSRVKLPKGDVLIHAGDLTNQGSYSELQRAVAWLEAAPFECKIVVAGRPSDNLYPDRSAWLVADRGGGDRHE